MKKSRRFRDLRLRTKLMISYSALLLILLVFWGMSAYLQINRQLTQNAQKEFTDSAELTAILLENKIQRAERALRLIVENRGAAETFSAPYLSQYQQASNLLRQFDPLLANVNELNEYIAEPRIYTYYGLKGSRNYIRDAAAVSGTEALYLKCGSEPAWVYADDALAVSAKLVNPDSIQNAATVTFIIDRDEFFRECLPNSWDYDFCVTDAQGQEVYCSRKVEDPGSWENAELLTQEIMLDDQGWTLRLQINAQPQMLSMTATFRVTVFSVLLSLVLLIPLILFWSRGFSRRIDRLRETVSRIVPSRYELEITPDSADEIGQITETIGEMVTDTKRVIVDSYQDAIARRDAQIQALQAQINPHFLYNTLSNLNWRAIARGDMETSNLLNTMSRFYRLTLNNGQAIATIGQELEHVQLYVRIQCAIHSQELAQEAYQVDEDLLDYHMPSVILQPIVENAIEHGINAGGFENGRLTVAIRREGENLVICVSDNGPGIAPETVAAIFDENNHAVGYGMHNVYRRLRLFFDDHCRMTFEASPGGGTTVVLHIPPYVQPETEGGI